MRVRPASWGGRSGWRLFLTVWLVYSLFVTTNVVRETYLAVALGERLTVRVDAYRELHPDLFEIPGRGWFINSNPGASLVGALPYAALVRPAIALAVRLKPGIAAPKPPATYDDPRPNRARFMNAARARGLDIVLGLAALGTGVTVMAALGALASLLMFHFLRTRLGDERKALGYSLVFAFATPMFFRVAFLNQNAIVAHLVLAAWVLKVGLTARSPQASPTPAALAGVGGLLGFATVCDFSALPFVLVFGCWALADGWRRGRWTGALGAGASYSTGVAITLCILFVYQWTAFGHPLWPAQRYMPPTEYSVRGWLGFTVPTFSLLVGNLFDPRFGLFAFSPVLLAALAAPFARGSGALLRRGEMGWIVACFAGLWLFSSANQFANLQWNTGVRYMVPMVPLLFIAAVPALDAMPRAARWSLIGLSGAITVAVTMTREDIPDAMRMIRESGPTLPILTVLRKVESGYQVQVPAFSFWIIAAITALLLVVVWRRKVLPASAA